MKKKRRNYWWIFGGICEKFGIQTESSQESEFTSSVRFFRLMRCFSESFLLLSLVLLSSSSLCYVSAACAQERVRVCLRATCLHRAARTKFQREPQYYCWRCFCSLLNWLFFAHALLHTVWKSYACERESACVMCTCLSGVIVVCVSLLFHFFLS